VRAPQASSPGNPDAKTNRLILHSTVKIGGIYWFRKKMLKYVWTPKETKSVKEVARTEKTSQFKARRTKQAYS